MKIYRIQDLIDIEVDRYSKEFALCKEHASYNNKIRYDVRYLPEYLREEEGHECLMCKISKETGKDAWLIFEPESIFEKEE